MTKPMLVIATHNPGKQSEFQALLKDLPYQIKPISAYEHNELPETELSFIESALKKARHASKKTGFPSLADDSGLVVPALLGEPGIYSARYAGEPRNDEKNIEKLLTNLKQHPSQEARKAYFYCVIVLLQHAHDPAPIIAEGWWKGTILKQARGSYGFGYDPIFFVPSHQCSAAELKPFVKNQLSHRGQACAVLIQRLKINDA